MALSEARLRATKKYQDKFDRVQIRVTHEEKEALENHAEVIGESVNSFVRRAITEAIARDQANINQTLNNSEDKPNE